MRKFAQLTARHLLAWEVKSNELFIPHRA